MDANIRQAIKDAAYNIGNAYYSEKVNTVTTELAKAITESLKCWVGGDLAKAFLYDLAVALNNQRDEF